MVSTSRIEAISDGFQRRPGGEPASANGTPIASRQALEQSLSDDGGGDIAIRSQTLPSPPLRFLDPDAEGCAHLLVEHEQMLGAFTFGGEPRLTIESIHGSVERLMGASEPPVTNTAARVVKNLGSSSCRAV